jgi:uncharacterized phage-like protein YoqJ
MKIQEIIDYNNKHDLIDSLRNSTLIELDKLYDTINKLSLNFNIESELLSANIIQEMKDDFNRLFPLIIKSFPEKDNKWNIKIFQLKDYFNV